jgi:hypothetical protein
VLVAGMNRYRAWIDGGDVRVLLAAQLLSWMVMGTLMSLVYAAWYAPLWVAMIGLAAIPAEVYLGVAQMTSWRWDGPRLNT